MDEPQFVDRQRRKDEWVRVGQTEPSIQIIQYVRQRKPAADETLERRWSRRHRVRRLGERGFIAALRAQRQTARRRRLECVDDVQIVRPGFGPVFPGM